ncbi:ribosomal protein L10 [Denitrovibrio acetiphilus DSM 12809]|uniref:Large ribosomal subunit protein uL10 n=1 Tax=Denitrovibrio acetiphilus (strain DSM 12809 / NBRC 114555 / N2460) TaxID=522772 RepID=D4H379_DENA2|nr:50S ribosomal protein L10 [Denitrovibrio acetiphilus]ADD67163.1 ribosomal protein L10 [Denitrovibrio acetiphilus DSM 12809]
MKKADKEQLVAELSAQVKDSDALFLTNYKGLTYLQQTAVRSEIKEKGSDFKVVKNTLLKIALNNNDIDSMDSYLVEPTACAIVTGDVAAVAKTIKKYAKEFDKFEIKAGYLDGNVLTANDVNVLADLPSRDELLAKMLSSMNAPVSNFVSLLANIPRSLVNVLTAVKDKKDN